MEAKTVINRKLKQNTFAKFLMLMLTINTVGYTVNVENENL
jgi:hypothetical protein